MRFATAAAFATALYAAAGLAQNCGPKYGNQICASKNCCSMYGWCDTDAAHCDLKTCLKAYSAKDSVCYRGTTTPTTTKKATTTLRTSTKTTTTTSKAPTSTAPYASQIPVIDVCGAGSGAQNVSCPGAGIDGYFYRCCSTAGHCGPKNNIQDESLYCGSGCQPGYGDCNSNRPKPADPTGQPGVAQNGETCGPIVNKKCAPGLCCSGSNFCGTDTDFCGAANWCQPKWGQCSGS